MRLKVIVIFSFFGIVLSGCTSSSASSQPGTPSQAVSPSNDPSESSPEADVPSAGTPSADPPPHWPFTGLPAPNGLPDRRAMIVKIDNTLDAEPQVGLASADLVIEELVEGGFTRLAAFYYSTLPETVGPVRSVRTSDIGFVLPVNALLVASGGAPEPLRRLKEAGILTAFEDMLPGFFRASDRVAVHDLLLHPRQAISSLWSTTAPTDYLSWATDQEAPFQGQPVTRLSAVFSPSHTSAWQYQPGSGWVRTNGLEDPNDRFIPDNIVILQVRLQEAPYVDPSGATVPETILVGSGRAVVIHENQAISGHWEKNSAAADLHLVDQHGNPLSVPPGETCIELVPNTGSVQLAH